MKRLDNLQGSIKKIQQQEMAAWQEQNNRHQVLKENQLLKDTLGRKEKENLRLQSTYEKKLRQTEQWEDETLNIQLEDVRNENQRLKG